MTKSISTFVGKMWLRQAQPPTLPVAEPVEATPEPASACKNIINDVVRSSPPHMLF
jgi:hypothetical protein